jgi:ribokinase
MTADLHDSMGTDRVDVCVVGSANLDLVAVTDRLPGPGETVMGSDYAEHPGGKGLNQAVAAARAGARTAFVGAVGNDDAGRRLLGVMVADGIDALRVRDAGDVPTGRALIGVSAAGENSIIVVPGANATVAIDSIPTATVVLAQLEVPIDAIVDAFTRARACGATTVLNPAPAQALGPELLSLCDVVVPNEHEAQLLGGVAGLLAAGARAVVVTLGARGAALHTADGSVDIAPFSVVAVDTTGAGDTFCGSLSARLALGETIDVALRYASAAAALSTTRRGAVPSVPRTDEVDALLTTGG